MTWTHHTLFILAAIVCFVVLVVLVIADSTSVKLEAVLLPLGLGFFAAGHLP